MVGSGLFIGYLAAKLSKTPPAQVRAVMAACGFSNSTGLPITLLTVVHANFPDSSDLGKIDPCLFLTVYLLLYPVLQWGIGGWLLAPETAEETDEEKGKLIIESPTKQNVLNQREPSFYHLQRRGMAELDASMYMSVQESLDKWGRPTPALGDTSSEEESIADPEMFMEINKNDSFGSVGMDLSKPGSFTSLHSIGGMDMNKPDSFHNLQSLDKKELAYQIEKSIPPMPYSTINETSPLIPEEPLIPVNTDKEPESTKDTSSNTVQDVENCCATYQKICKRSLQPPVVGALLGILVASFPVLRGALVDLEDRTGDAPLQWMFDGLYEVGQAAVPINMIILGCNLSGSYSATIKKTELFSASTTIAIVVSKMIVMPIFGILSVIVFREYYWSLPEDIAGSFYLVAMIVFLTPTANNVMVMVELSGSGSKQGLARIIAWQYAVSPIFLSLTMTIAVGLADKWSS